MARKYRVTVNGKAYDVDVEELAAGAAPAPAAAPCSGPRSRSGSCARSRSRPCGGSGPCARGSRSGRRRHHQRSNARQSP